MKLLFLLSDIKLWFITVILQLHPINNFVTKYIFADVTFLKWLFIAMTVDLLTGLGKALKLRESITSRGLRDTISKCIQYGGFLIITHVLTHYQVLGQSSLDLAWLNKIACEFIILIEIKSVYENLIVINPKLDLFAKAFKKLAELLNKNKK